MTDLQQAPTVDVDKLMAFVFKAVDEVGATLNTALVVLGDKLGYYTTMAAGPVTPAQLADSTGTGEPYAREWLNAQAAGGYVEFDATAGHYTLPPEQAAALTDPSSPAYLPGFFQIALGTIHDIDDVLQAARTHAGLGWHEHHADVHDGCERFFRTMYNAHLVGEWLPALDGVVDKLERGATVADVGCGHGASTVIMAQAFPNSTFIGFDYHEASIATARARAIDAGVGDRVRFEVAAATQFPGARFDLVPRSMPCTTWEIRSAQPGTSMPPLRPRAPGWSSSPWQATASVTTSTRSGGLTTGSPPCCAPRRHLPKRSVWPSAPRLGPHGSATWSRRAASLDSPRSHRPPSIGSSKSGPESAAKRSRISA